MATNYKQSGKRVLVNSASGTITAGKLVAQEGFFGVALTSAATGAALWLGIEGVWNIAVYSGTAKGDILHASGAKGVFSDSTGLTLSPTGANSNSPVAKALTAADTAGKADCLILAQGAAMAAIQV
jgi:predicted RecA/RadA family phage recombinase